MEYHKHRFDDYSLMFFKKEKLIAVLPANIKNNEVYSHLGLSYGGLVLHEKADFFDVFNIYKLMLQFLESNAIKKLHLKILPSIYCSLPSEEIDYLLYKTKAVLTRTDVTSAIQGANKLPIASSNRKRGLAKALKQGLVVKENTDFENYWNQLLIPNLQRTHNAKPVHSLSEIIHLKEKFPKNIRQFNVYNNSVIVAGATIFETKQVARVQYIASNEQRQQLGGLDLLFHNLIYDVYADKKYFDFGISNENAGVNINEGLLHWKESFGARTISHKFYTVETGNHTELDNVMV